MSECGTKANVAPDCASKSALGVWNKGWAFLLEDFRKSTLTETARVISAIDMPTGTRAYSIECKPGGHNVRSTGSIGDAGEDRHLHEWDIKFPNMGILTKQSVESYMEQMWVCVVPVKTGKVEDQYQVMFRHTGGRLINPVYDSSANGGQIAGTISNNTTPNAEFEPNMPDNFYITDAATTEALLDSYLAPQS